MRCLIAALMIISVLAVMPTVVLAQESALGTITGQIVNGTDGGGSVSGVEVTLITYVDDMMAGTEIVSADSTGAFQFTNISLDNEYLVSARYMDVDYYYQVVFAEGETTANIEVPVCDITASDEMIRMELAYTVIELEADSVLVTEYLWLVNDGDRTYVGTDGALVFTMPAGATEFGAPAELMTDYQLLENSRVSYLVPFPPGERQLAYYYRLPGPDSGKLAISLETDYPTDSYELLVSGEDVEVSANGLAPAEPVTADDGTHYICYQGEAIERGTRLDIQISASSGSNSWLLPFLGGIGALAMVAAGYYLISKRKKEI